MSKNKILLGVLAYLIHAKQPDADATGCLLYQLLWPRNRADATDNQQQNKSPKYILFKSTLKIL